MAKDGGQTGESEGEPPPARKESAAEASKYQRRPVEYCSRMLQVRLTPTQEKIARLLVRPPYKILVRAGHNVGHNDAARTDVQFGLLWDRGRRALVPELIVLHLESEDAATGANWSGRKTRPFGRAVTAAAVPCPSPCS